ncbi:MAG: PilZ domain-containing protein [Deltaproteobacteria bacterium]|nr:PilZ domain-containing protein [Deltaproteobacteria bacterium]
MEPIKVYVNVDFTAVFTCPHCGKSKTMNVEKYKDKKGPLKVRCKCRGTYPVTLEFRRQYRKPTELAGDFSCPDNPLKGGKMVVKNVSMGGVGFVPRGRHNLAAGDRIYVKFLLDDPKRSLIEKRCIVRVAENQYIGAQFDVQPGTYDAALGFYLRR